MVGGGAPSVCCSLDTPHMCPHVSVSASRSSHFVGANVWQALAAGCVPIYHGAPNAHVCVSVSVSV